VRSSKALDDEARRLLAALTPRDAKVEIPSIGLRAFASSTDFCALSPSPLVAAIYDASEGRAVTTIDEAQALAHFGCSLGDLPSKPPRTICGRTGGRGGKTSRLVAVKALHAAWTTPLPTLGVGEYASALIVAPDMRLARQALSFASGYAQQSPVLRGALVQDPRKDDIEIRRPDGKLVRIEILPATAKGTATRARTLVFAAMDEAEFFFDADSGVVNDEDVYRSVLQRLVPGGQAWLVSTPWIAHTGLLEKMLDKDFGRHEHALCFVGGTRALNPTWDPGGEIERDLREQDPIAAQREIDGIPSGGTASSFFEPESIEAAIDDSLVIPRRPLPGEQVTAGGDMGFTNDAAAIAAVHRDARLYRVADLLELRPIDGQPLKPSETVRTFAQRLRQNHPQLEHLVADGHYRETVAEFMAEEEIGFQLCPQGAEGVATTYMRARQLFREKIVRIPRHARLIAQLLAIRWRPNPGGTISIVKPRTKAKPGEPSGGHCDLADAAVLALWEASGLEVEAPPPAIGSKEYYQAQADEAWARVEEGLQKKASGDWWEAPGAAGGILDD
jgi:hypothetical protein